MLLRYLCEPEAWEVDNVERIEILFALMFIPVLYLSLPVWLVVHGKVVELLCFSGCLACERERLSVRNLWSEP